MERVTAAGLTWPLPDDLDDAALEALRAAGRPPKRAAVTSPTGASCTRN